MFPSRSPRKFDLVMPSMPAVTLPALLKGFVCGGSQPYFITEHAVEVLELMFGFLFGFLTTFLLHFIDIHRYGSPANKADYLCIRSFRKLRVFAIGVFFYSSYPSRRRLSRLLTTTPFPPSSPGH